MCTAANFSLNLNGLCLSMHFLLKDQKKKILCETEDTSLYLSFAGDILVVLTDVPAISIVKSLK